MPLPGAPGFDPSDFLMLIDWHGPETKPVHRAGFATPGRARDLERWREVNERVRHGAILSEGEVTALERTLGASPFSMREGPCTPERATQQYVLTVSSGGSSQHVELGFSRDVATKVERIRACLDPASTGPADRIIDQVQRWES